MDAFGEFAELAAREGERADFVVVYIAEAHPTDGWLYPAVDYKIKQPIEIEERLAAARILHTKKENIEGDVKIPLLVDSMTNSAALCFGALPERRAIVVDGTVAWIGGDGPMNYSVQRCAKALSALQGA